MNGNTLLWVLVGVGVGVGIMALLSQTSRAPQGSALVAPEGQVHNDEVWRWTDYRGRQREFHIQRTVRYGQ